jgi:hypothetical protein
MTATPMLMTETENALNNPELDPLAAHESVIKRHFGAFAEVGAALMAIRNGRLYYAAGYHTFEDYCRDRWGIVASRARHYITAARINENIRGVTTVTPANEAQLRPLAGLSAEEQREAWRQATIRAAAEGQSVTGRHVQVAVRERQHCAARAALPYVDTDAGAGKEAVKDLERRGILTPTDLDGITPEGRIALVWEASRADEELSIEWREQHPDALVAEGEQRFSRSILRRFVLEAAERLRAGTLDAADVRGVVRADQRLEAATHAEACDSFETSLSAMTQRVRRCGWHDAGALAKVRQRHDEIRKALDAFMIAAAKLEVVLAAKSLASSGDKRGPAD